LRLPNNQVKLATNMLFLAVIRRPLEFLELLSVVLVALIFSLAKMRLFYAGFVLALLTHWKKKQAGRQSSTKVAAEASHSRTITAKLSVFTDHYGLLIIVGCIVMILDMCLHFREGMDSATLWGGKQMTVYFGSDEHQERNLDEYRATYKPDWKPIDGKDIFPDDNQPPAESQRRWIRFWTQYAINQHPLDLRLAIILKEMDKIDKEYETTLIK
jgi:hypothetical protein